MGKPRRGGTAGTHGCPSSNLENTVSEVDQPDTNRTTEQISDAEYNHRYLSRLANRIKTEGMQDADSARMFAQDYLEDCPRDGMAAEYVNDPEKAADEAFHEWRDAGRDDDVEEDYSDEPLDDDEEEDDDDFEY